MDVHFDVQHTKCLAPTQFDAMKGSNIHAIMTARRVWLKPKSSKSTSSAIKTLGLARNWLQQNCTNFYFIADKSSNVELRVYFLSKHDMEHFVVWAKLKLS